MRTAVNSAHAQPGLPLERLREADQVAGVAGVELDHAAGHELVVRADQAALRRLPVVRVRRQVDAEERALGAGAAGVRRRDPAAQQHAHQPPGDDLDADRHLVDLLALHPAHDGERSSCRLP